MSLNRQQREKFVTSHMNQKYNLVHMASLTGPPQLSGLYLKSFYNAAKRNRLQLPEHITGDGTKFCGKCGCVRIGGVNVRQRLEDVSDELSNGGNQVLSYECLDCGDLKSFPIKRTGVRENTGKPVAGPFTESMRSKMPGIKEAQKSGSENGIGKRSSAKERAKKRKLSTLSNLLSKKNGEKQPKKSSLLNLEDFLKK
ncbi:LAMI_0B04192g1_1 [Lachancea mirantina]|uniref:LAMI_0B04192g1_1 n=1 Tax=Lachancea mirantina TaxID=1230905 RepID=A0A1G4IV62_9SACH|nr:LAMI_0B04192g1_1 [Lachancea mirantina]